MVKQQFLAWPCDWLQCICRKTAGFNLRNLCFWLSKIFFSHKLQLCVSSYQLAKCIKNRRSRVKVVAVSCGYDTWFAVRLVMDYTTSHFAWSILGYLLDTTRSSLPQPDTQVSRCLWVVLWLLFFRSAPSTFPATWSTFKGQFRGVPSR